MTQAIVLLLNSSSVCYQIDQDNNTVLHLKQNLSASTGIPVEDQVLTKTGQHLNDDDILELQVRDHFLSLTGRLRGGKGGFGSMLRAQGGRMNAQKTTNFEACRDLQGRRIRSVNEAKKLQEELDALPEREAEKREKLKRKIEDALKEREPRKYLFDDNKFLEDREEMVENVKSAVENALKRQKIAHKPAASASTSASLFDDELSSEEDEEEEEEEEEEGEEDEESKQEEEKKDVKGKGKSRTEAEPKVKGKGKANGKSKA